MNQSKSFEEARAGLSDLSPSVSLWWKPLRRLFADGNPIDPVHMLYYNLGKDKRLPFAALSKTGGNRLVLWLPSDSLEPCEFEDGQTFPFDHATLELSNGKTHFTRFNSKGVRIHEPPVWKVADLGEGLQHWLVIASRASLLEKQVGALEQRVRMPENDSKRREDEVRRYLKQMEKTLVDTPPLRDDCFVTVIHLLENSATFDGAFKPSHFPMGSFWDDWIEGWPNGDNFQITGSAINVGGVNLLVVTASPLGRLKDPFMLGCLGS